MSAHSTKKNVGILSKSVHLIADLTFDYIFITELSILNDWALINTPSRDFQFGKAL